MRGTIKGQLMGAFIVLISSMIIVFLMINGGFLERYYINNKRSVFENVYEILEEGNIHERTREIDNIVERNNIALMVIDRDYNMIYQSARNAKQLEYQLQGYLFDKNTLDVLEEEENYIICRTVDERNGAEYIEMWGELDNEAIFLMRSPLESIRSAVEIFHRFVASVGGTILFIGIGIAWYLSKRITEPLQKLAQLSAKMANLDFDAKYVSEGTEEIDVLGQNFNQMSISLERTISDLKNANLKLQHDIEKKEKMENMRLEFFGNVSHELKTPIALIQGYAEGLKEGVSENPEDREFYCDVIVDEAAKMNQLVTSLLSLNQLECGGSDLQMERFNIVEMIHGVLQSYEIIIQQKGAQISFTQKEPVYVWADQLKIEQVIRNYLVNALNHVSEDMVIEIKIVLEGTDAKISVFNTGKPIPEEDVEFIWDKFYKVDKAHTRSYGGHGIGLSIVKAIMDVHHKACGLTNYDNGVAFWFVLDMK